MSHNHFLLSLRNALLVSRVGMTMDLVSISYLILERAARIVRLPARRGRRIDSRSTHSFVRLTVQRIAGTLDLYVFNVRLLRHWPVFFYSACKISRVQLCVCSQRENSLQGLLQKIFYFWRYVSQLTKVAIASMAYQHNVMSTFRLVGPSVIVGSIEFFRIAHTSMVDHRCCSAVNSKSRSNTILHQIHVVIHTDNVAVCQVDVKRAWNDTSCGHSPRPTRSCHDTEKSLKISSDVNTLFPSMPFQYGPP